jgi:arylsulfatase
MSGSTRSLISRTLLFFATLCSAGWSWGADKPNVLIVLVDDLGFSDIEPYGGEIETPHLSALAAEGLKFTQFYNTARCWPTRGALMTGYYAQQIRRDTLEGIPSGGRGERPDWAPLVPVHLKQAGYRCYHSGKWHIDSTPIKAGFDRSYWLQDSGRFFSPKVHFEDDVKLPPVAPDAGYYSTTAITDHCLKTLKQHRSDYSEQPFFHYLCYLAPHFPLHALPEDIAKYAGRYTAGWNDVQQERFQRQQELKLLPGAVLAPMEPEVGPPYHFPNDLQILGPGEVNRPVPWDSLTAEQMSFQAAKMAIHAAMVDRVDQELGRIIQYLKEQELYENTLILFLSDNGGSAEIMVRDDGHDPAAVPGSAKTHLCLGPGWSSTSNTPFRRHKTWVHEGGISTPLIACWPKGIPARGELRTTPGHVIDIVPTVLALAGLQPSLPEGAPPLPGIDLSPLFERDGAVQHASLWWQHEGNRAYRRGNWKIVAAGKDADWELYNLETDRTELHNLAEQHPELVQELATLWQQQLDEFRALYKP